MVKIVCVCGGGGGERDKDGFKMREIFKMREM